MKVLYKLKDDQFEFKGITHNRVAARAVVFNDENKVGILRVYGQDIFGFRDYFETPGGGVKENEDLKEAVKREVLEELGVSAEILDEIGIVEDDYNLIYRRNIVYYYLMKVTEIKEKHLEEYEKTLIDDVRWLDIDEVISCYENLKDEKLAILIKRRELPILKLAKELYFKKNS